MFQQQLHQFGVTFSVGSIQLGAVKEQMKTNLLATMERGDNLEDIEVGTRKFSNFFQTLIFVHTNQILTLSSYHTQCHR